MTLWTVKWRMWSISTSVGHANFQNFPFFIDCFLRKEIPPCLYCLWLFLKKGCVPLLSEYLSCFVFFFFLFWCDNWKLPGTKCAPAAVSALSERSCSAAEGKKREKKKHACFNASLFLHIRHEAWTLNRFYKLLGDLNNLFTFIIAFKPSAVNFSFFVSPSWHMFSLFSLLTLNISTFKNVPVGTFK